MFCLMQPSHVHHCVDLECQCSNLSLESRCLCLNSLMTIVILRDSKSVMCVHVVRTKFFELDLKPVCKSCYDKFPAELKKRLKKAYDQQMKKWRVGRCDCVISSRSCVTELWLVLMAASVTSDEWWVLALVFCVCCNLVLLMYFTVYLFVTKCLTDDDIAAAAAVDVVMWELLCRTIDAMYCRYVAVVVIELSVVSELCSSEMAG